MPRYAFFSFAYEDVSNFKANVVRNSWLLRNSEDSFVDGSIWEKSKIKDPNKLKQLISIGLKKTSVTIVLIGKNTANRRWVQYEIIKSFEKGNGIIGIHINRIKGRTGLTKRGPNPFDKLSYTIGEEGRKIYFSELNNRRWVAYQDLPIINNKVSNTLYFKHHWWNGNNFGETFKFSDHFPTYCWDFDDGHKNLPKWIEEAANSAGR